MSTKQGKLLKNLDSYAIAFMLSGLPVIYFLRDNVGLAPNNSLFTIVGTLGLFFVSMAFKDFKSFERPHVINYLLLSLFIIYLLAYFVLRDPYTGLNKTYEYANLTVMVLMIVFVPFLRTENFGRAFLLMGIYLSLVGALALIYALYNDPFYVIGQRAAMRFGKDENAQANPHIFAKNGYYGLIYALMALKYYDKVKIFKPLSILVLVLSLVEIVVTQTVVTILATIITLSLYFWYNFSFKSTFKFLSSILKKWYVLIILVFVVFKAVKAINDNPLIISAFTQVFTNRLAKVFNSVSSDSKEKGTVDESASGRVAGMAVRIKLYNEDIENGKVRHLIFGHGYKAMYIDVPHFEIFDSYGLIGFIFYTFIFFRLVKACLYSMKHHAGYIEEFFAYSFFYWVLLNFSGGQAIDFTRIIAYILVAKFVRAEYLKYSSGIMKNYGSRPQVS